MVSVIVPVYNDEKHLEKCIRSLLQQTYKNIEIIVVNDGSTDGTEEILSTMVKEDARIKAIHKKNEGVSVARNTALMQAQGQYIVFADSDDTMPVSAIDVLVSSLVQSDADFVLGATLDVYPHKKVSTGIEKGIVLKEDIPSYVLEHLYAMGGPWGKIYKREIIQNYDICFQPGMPYGEDTLFVLEYIIKCIRIATSSEIVYAREINYQGASYAGKYYKDMSIYLNRIMKSTERLINACSKPEQKATLISVAVSHYCNMAVKHYLLCAMEKKERYEKVRQTVETFLEYAKYPKTGAEYGIWRDIQESNLESDGLHRCIVYWDKKSRINRYKLKFKKKLLKMVFRG